jgi:hypothetical protein
MTALGEGLGCGEEDCLGAAGEEREWTSLVDLDMERNTLLADNRTALEAHFPDCTLLYGRYPQQPQTQHQGPLPRDDPPMRPVSHFSTII